MHRIQSYSFAENDGHVLIATYTIKRKKRKNSHMDNANESVLQVLIKKLFIKLKYKII